MNMESLLSSSVGVNIGAIITWWVARRYYERGSRDLTQTATALQQALNALAGFLEQSGSSSARVSFRRDEYGNVRGLNVTLEVQPARVAFSGGSHNCGHP